MQEAKGYEETGNITAAIEIWRELVASLEATGNNKACGLYAQKQGRALDQMGNYTDAVAYFDKEIALWSKLPDHEEWYLLDSFSFNCSSDSFS